MVKEYLVFERLTINNFIPFYGEQYIEFSIDPEKNVTLINGYQNGSGKTTLFQLFAWILFDDHEFRYLKEASLEGKKSLEAVINNKAKDEKDEFKVGGKLDFILIDILGHETQYQISKYFNVKKKSNSNLHLSNEETRVIKEGRSIEGEDLKEFYLKIKKMYPLGIRELIFIPGEKLEHIFDPKYDKQLKEFAIHNSELPNLENVTKLLDKYQKYVNDKRIKEQKRDSQLRGHNDDLKQQEGTKDAYQNELQEIRDKINEIDEKSDNLNNQLDNFDKIQDIIESYRKLSGEFTQIELKLETEQNNFSLLLKEGAKYLYLEDAMTEILEDIKNKDFPELIDRDTAMKFIKRQICCCGRELGEVQINFIRDNFINNHPEGEKAEVAFVFKEKLEEIIRLLPEIKRKLLNKQKELVEISKNLRRKKNDLKNIDDELTDEEKSEDYYKQYQEIRKNLTIFTELNKALLKQEAGIQHEIKEIDKKLNIIKGQIKGAETTTQKSYKWADARDKLVILDNLFGEIVKRYNSELKDQTKDNVTKIYRDISNFPDSIHRVEIYDTKNGGWNIVPYFKEKEMASEYEMRFTSTGETHILGLAYILGISNTLDVKLPLIFDSPFVHIDQASKIILAEKVPINMNQSQVIFFVKDTEMSNEVKKKLERYEGKNIDLKIIKKWYYNEIKN